MPRCPCFVDALVPLYRCHFSVAATLWFSLVGVVSIGSLNLSLLVNPVGLYQVRFAL